MADRELLHQVTCIAREYRDGILDDTLMVREMTAALSSPAPAQVDDAMVERATRAIYGEQPKDGPGMRMRSEMRRALTAALAPTPQEQD